LTRGILDAPELAEEEEYAWESQGVAENAPPDEYTVVKAVQYLRGIAYHTRTIEGIDDAAGTLLAQLQAEVERITAWAIREKERPLNSIAHHKAWLAQYYELHPPKKGKTINLPGGSVTSRKVADEWTFPTDKKWVALVQSIRPDLVNVAVETVTTVNKTFLKGACRIKDKVAHLANSDGELIALPISVVAQDEKVTIELEEVADNAQG
jgi:hypothetical protein